MDDIKKDARFAHISKDPRFRPSSRSERKLKIDRRFASMFSDPKFKLRYTVDKRGRPLLHETTTRDDMNKFYHVDEEQEDEGSEDSSADNEEVITTTKEKDELDELLTSDDEEKEKEAEETSDSSSDESEVPEVEDGSTWNEFDENCVRSEEVTRRLAVCNMDWDRVRAVDIFVLLNSFKGSDGQIKSVTIYPSQFGLEQIEIEKRAGPIPGSTVSIETHGSSVTRQVDDSGVIEEDAEEVDEDPELKSDDDDEQNAFKEEDDDQETSDPVARERLRKYQLNRLKYFYAIVECDSKETAGRIYDECDGLEYETSAVRLDLRFVPDSTNFDDGGVTPHDQCTHMPEKTVYKPILFRNTALTQSKVRCTWDETPIERRQLMKKKYTMEELEKHELDAYLASESEEEVDQEEQDDESGNESDHAENQKDVFKVPKIPSSSRSKETAAQPIARAPSILSSQDDIDRYRALLLDFNDPEEPDKKNKLLKKKNLANFFGDDNEEVDSGDDLPLPSAEAEKEESSDSTSDIDMEITWQPGGLKMKKEEEDKPSIGQAKKNAFAKKNKKKDKSFSKQQEQFDDDRDKEAANEMNTHDSLELLTVDDDAGNEKKQNYNLKHLIKQQKQQTRKKNKKVPLEDSDFHLNVEDQRFQALYDQAEFNIDPSDPHFKDTAGAHKLIEEKLKKRKFDQIHSSSKSRTADGGDDELLVSNLKRKAAKLKK